MPLSKYPTAFRLNLFGKFCIMFIIKSSRIIEAEMLFNDLRSRHLLYLANQIMYFLMLFPQLCIVHRHGPASFLLHIPS
jgi:hypothetical protein